MKNQAGLLPRVEAITIFWAEMTRNSKRAEFKSPEEPHFLKRLESEIRGGINRKRPPKQNVLVGVYSQQFSLTLQISHEG